eukprot:EG_transcript_19348
MSEQPTFKREPPRHGKTLPGRLQRLDAFLLAYCPALTDVAHRPTDEGTEVVVDVGLGDYPWTTLELADRLAGRRDAGTLCVLGTECDYDRLQAAIQMLPSPPPKGLEFRWAKEGAGWFGLPLRGAERPVCIRALNVLRDYHPADARRALPVLARQLAPGGLLVEGSADADGGRATVMLLRRDDLNAGPTLEAIVFLVDLAGQYSRRCRVRRCPPPLWFEGRLPQVWLHEPPAGATQPAAPVPTAVAPRGGGGEAWVGGARPRPGLVGVFHPPAWRAGTGLGGAGGLGGRRLAGVASEWRTFPHWRFLAVAHRGAPG